MSIKISVNDNQDSSFQAWLPPYVVEAMKTKKGHVSLVIVDKQAEIFYYLNGELIGDK